MKPGEKILLIGAVGLVSLVGYGFWLLKDVNAPALKALADRLGSLSQYLPEVPSDAKTAGENASRINLLVVGIVILFSLTAWQIWKAKKA